MYTVHFRPGGARALFTTRDGGVSTGHLSTLNLGAMVGDRVENVRENRTRACQALGASLGKLVTADQVHGERIVFVDELAELEPGPAGNPVAGEGDALVTDRRGVLLAVLVADCVPILLFDPGRRVVAAIHAGWRGTLAGLAFRTVRTLQTRYGSDPKDLQGVIGPSIGPCCYEVDEPVISLLQQTLPDQFDHVLAATTPTQGMLDLWGTNRSLLLKAGIPARALHTTGLCTACNPSRFFSHRAEEGNTGRMAAIIMLE